MKRRRTALGLSQRAAAHRAGISPTTWGSLETHAQRIDDLTRPRVARALRWTPDSIDRILDGREPEEDDEPEPPTVDERLTAVEAEVAEIRQILRRVERAVEGQAT